MPSSGPIVYRIYKNDGQGGAIDYSTPVAETTAATWTSGPLNAPGSYRFGVRARDETSGLEEANIDAAAALILNAQAGDATRTPPAPVGLRAIPLAGGRVRLEWATPVSSSDRRPFRFNIYMSPGAITSYAVPTATTPAASARNGFCFIELGGLADGVAFEAVIRSANDAGEESNVSAVRFTADSSAPDGVDGLLAAPTSRSSG